jgi:hypothetical protein
LSIARKKYGVSSHCGAAQKRKNARKDAETVGSSPKKGSQDFQHAHSLPESLEPKNQLGILVAERMESRKTD